MRVIIRGNWAPYVGTDYCDALGVYDSIAAAEEDGETYALDRWEPDDEDESGMEDEGPDYTLEEYNPDKHDGYRTGGGCFEDDFKRFEN